MAESDLFATYSVEPVMVVLFKPNRILDSAFVRQMSDSLKDLARRAHEDAFVLDFSRVGYLSSAALGMLLGLQRELARLGREMKVAGLSPETREVFRITKLDGIFDMYPDVAAAIEAFRKHE